MVLEGVVTKVAAFGAFVMWAFTRTGWCTSRRWPMPSSGTPRAAKPGDVVRVKVLEVDPIRCRISLTMWLDDASEARSTKAHAEIVPTEPDKPLRSAGRNTTVPGSGDVMVEAFRRAGLTGKCRVGTRGRRASALEISGKTRANPRFPDTVGGFPDHPI
jgi:protein Tex